MNILNKLNNKNEVGIYSACTANQTVIEAVLERAKRDNSIAVIEATANQVNQFGGYTGMNPGTYRDFVYELADAISFPRERIVLGGDHLGPLTWVHLDESEAMKNAEDLVYAYVEAGFTKIHLDTSMKVSSDDENLKLSDEIIARRTVQLAHACKAAYALRLKNNIDAIAPVYIIGSEVPIPGGAQEVEEMEVTTFEQFKTTYETFKLAFDQADLNDVFEQVIAVVVQPGVEFGDAKIDFYNPEKASNLTSSLKQHYPNLVFEGHSTDYQTPALLRKMVQDGINILKVGPALTFAYREALFALAHIENEIIEKPVDFISVLEEVMVDEPGYWKKYYHGTALEQSIKRKYSFSDRARYYLPFEQVDKAILKMKANLESAEIPLTLLSQYLPIQYRRVKEGLIENRFDDLVKDYINLYLDDYVYATKVATL